MKTYILFVALAILSKLTTFSQGCLPEGITFTTQEQIDSFQVNYPGCTEIEGSVTINSYNPDITNLNGMSVITSIGGTLEIQSLSALENLNGLASLQHVGVNLSILWNALLTDLSGLEMLSSVGGVITVSNNPALTSLNGIGSLSQVDAVEINGNNVLTNLDALNLLDHIPGNITINANAMLSDITGLENITSIGTALSILNSPGLTNLHGLESLDSIGGALFISVNQNLVSLSALDSLSSLGGSITIYSNPSLEELMNLNVDSINWGVLITENNALVSLLGFENLHSIDGQLGILDNLSLTDITALENIGSTSINNLFIINNPFLSECDVQSICEYLAAPGGTIEIHDNTPGCNSPEEVQEHCLTSVKENNINEGITLSPNPATTFITITTPQNQLVEEVIIYNQLGHKVLTEKPVNNTVDISGLKAGMYMVDVFTKANHIRKKLVIE
jgi:hypothetical protein